MRRYLGKAARGAQAKGGLARWQQAARAARDMPLGKLRSKSDDALQLRAALDDLIHVAEHRLALPVIGSTAFFRPVDADWSWRPELWRGPVKPVGGAAVESAHQIGSELRLFHDCPAREIVYRQIRNTGAKDLAPFGLRLDVLNFAGSFLSLVLDLPAAAAEGLSNRHLIRLDVALDLERPMKVFARLNAQHGPNVEQIVRELPLHEESVMVEFDLAYTDFDERRSEKLWIDLIFDDPALSRITVRDLTFSRRPRAEM